MTHLYESLWVNEVNNLSGRQYCVNKTLLLRSGFCDYSDAHIVVKGAIYLWAALANENDKADKNVAFKNNSPFISYILKINIPSIGNA